MGIMKKVAPGKQDDVSRLLKQLNMDSFEFRTFDRNQLEEGPEAESDNALSSSPQPSKGQPAPVAVPRAASATPVESSHSKRHEEMDSAFAWLLPSASASPNKKLDLRLNFAPRSGPVALPELTDLPVKSIFDRLNRIN